MALAQMPNGEIVQVPDDISDEALRRVEAQFPATRQQKVAAGMPRKPELTAEQKEVQARADFQENTVDKFTPDALRDTARGQNKGVFSSFNDELAGIGSAATVGLGRALWNMDPNKIIEEYRVTRDTERELDRRAQERSPVASFGGEMAGAMFNPVGSSSRFAGALPAAIEVGVKQGALNAAGAADTLSDVPGNVVEGGLLGGVMGGALGGATNLAQKGLQVLKDARPENATRAAYERVAKLLDNANMTPAQAERRIAVTDARGGDAMVQDMTPGLGAIAANLSTKAELRGSNELIRRGTDRIGNRQANFGQQVRETAGLQMDDALARGDQIAGARKQAGAEGYGTGGVMDTEIQPTLELQKYLKDAPEEVQGALRGAYREMLLRDEVPANFIGPDELFTHIPNLRTFDYVKRGFDTQIGQALRSGDKATAQGLSYQLDKLKGVLANANPKDEAYKKLLAEQRDMFQQQSALELGQNVLTRIVREPRIVVRELNKLSEAQQKEARIGIIDALINADNKANPVQFYKNVTRNPAQRQIMEFAFGGKGNLGRFDRWVNRELKAQAVDNFTAVGRQSGTMRYAGGELDDVTPEQEVLTSALRGMGFGGVTGAASNVVAAIRRVSNTTSKATQEEIAKILLSKGEGLVEGVDAAAKYKAQRLVRNRRRAGLGSKAGQQVFTDFLGNN